jgi:hypothetical protein
MPEQSNDIYEKEYIGRFEWRKERNINNLRELYQVAGDWEFIESLKGLFGNHVSDDPIDALKWSILDLWLETRECYVYGEFQACILSCGAVVERCLKLEYQKAKGILPQTGLMTLGKMIRECKGIVDQDVLDLAKEILNPRNDRAHALLEHSNPQLAINGGSERGIEIRGSQHYLIEPFRGEATALIELSSEILAKLYQNRAA